MGPTRRTQDLQPLHPASGQRVRVAHTPRAGSPGAGSRALSRRKDAPQAGERAVRGRGLRTPERAPPPLPEPGPRSLRSGRCPARASPARPRRWSWPHLRRGHLLPRPGAEAGGAAAAAAGLTVSAENFCAGAGGSSPASRGSQQSWGGSMVAAGAGGRAARGLGRYRPHCSGGRAPAAALPHRALRRVLAASRAAVK